MKILILCGGKGERLKPFTEETPKPLVKINSRPILAYILDYLISFNFTDFYILTGYNSKAFEIYFAHNYSNCKITLVDSGHVDIIVRLQEATKLFKDDFLVLYGDTLSDIDLNALILKNKTGNCHATVSVWPLRSPFGIVEMDLNSNVTNFLEKPVLDKWINIGYFYFRKEIISLFSEFFKYEDFLTYLSSSNKLNAYKHQGYHFTINTISELKYVEENINLIFKYKI